MAAAAPGEVPCAGGGCVPKECHSPAKYERAASAAVRLARTRAEFLGIKRRHAAEKAAHLERTGKALPSAENCMQAARVRAYKSREDAKQELVKALKAIQPSKMSLLCTCLTEEERRVYLFYINFLLGLPMGPEDKNALVDLKNAANRAVLYGNDRSRCLEMIDAMTGMEDPSSSLHSSSSSAGCFS